MGRVDQLIQQLESGDPNERYQAAKLLGQLGDPKALPALIRALDDSDANVHIAAARAVGKIGDLNAIQNLLDAYERRTVKFAEPIFEAIGEILGRTSPDDKNRAVFAGVVDRLIQFVQQDDSFDTIVRAKAAAEALGKTRDPKAIPILLERLRKRGSFEMAKAAARALRHFDDPQVIQALTEVAANKNIDGKLREAAVQSLGDIGNPEVVDTLIPILEEDSAKPYPTLDDTLRKETARTLGRIGNPKAIEPLIRALQKERDWSKFSLREAFIDALGNFRDPQVTDALVGALSMDYSTAAAAAGTLKKLRDKRAVEPLIRIVEDGGKKGVYTDHRRRFAAQVLGVLGDPRAIPALVNALHDDDEDIRKAARESLLAFVPTHPDAILQLPPDDRHRLGRQIQDAERDELSQKVCK
jgi:HEAT repeat protein